MRTTRNRIPALGLATLCVVFAGCAHVQPPLPKQEGPIVDAHAHLFNGDDFPLSYVWHASPAKLGVDRLATGTARRYKRFRRGHKSYDAIISPRRTPPAFRALKFLRAASASHQELEDYYFALFPTTDLVVPLYLDAEGWAYPGTTETQREAPLKYPTPRPAIMRMQQHAQRAHALNEARRRITAVPVAGFNPIRGVAWSIVKTRKLQCGKLRTEDQERHWCALAWSREVPVTEVRPDAEYGEYAESLLGNLVDPRDGRTPPTPGFKIYPSQGFYPAANCAVAIASARTLERDAVDDAGEAPEQLTEDFRPVRGHSKALQAVPLVPAELDDTAKRKAPDPAERREALVDAHAMDTLPWAPVFGPDQRAALPVPSRTSPCWGLHAEAMDRLRIDSSSEPEEVFGEQWGKRGCIKRNGKISDKGVCGTIEIVTRLRLAAALDEELSDLWGMSAAEELTVIAHASPEGAKLGKQKNHFEKYGAPAVWEALIALGRTADEGNQTANFLTATCEFADDQTGCERTLRQVGSGVLKSRKLLAHAWSPGRTKPKKKCPEPTSANGQADFLSRNKEEACRDYWATEKLVNLAADTDNNVWLDFSNNFVHEPEAKKPERKGDADLDRLRTLQARIPTRVVYGTDYWMHTAEARRMQPYQLGHERAFEPQEYPGYWFQNALELYGLRPRDKYEVRLCKFYEDSEYQNAEIGLCVRPGEPEVEDRQVIPPEPPGAPPGELPDPPPGELPDPPPGELPDPPPGELPDPPPGELPEPPEAPAPAD